MKTDQFDNLEDTLRTLGKRADLSLSSKRSIRDKVFQSIGQIELAEAIVTGEQKAVVVSLQYLKKALMPQRLSFSMPTTIAVVTFAFIASVMTGAIAQNANPTDRLFGVKKILQSIELAFIKNPVSKTEFTLNIADERLKYLESSLNEDKKLEQILKESQIALVSAKAALQKVQENEDQDSTDLVERFSSLLSDQRNLLNSINENATEEVKNTILAIRETLVESEEEKTDTTIKTDTDASSAVAVAPQTNINVSQPVISQPLGDGQHTFKTRVITAQGKVAVVVGDMHYIVVSSPVNLSLYVGFQVYVTGDISGKEIKIYEVASDSVILE